MPRDLLGGFKRKQAEEDKYTTQLNNVGTSVRSGGAAPGPQALGGSAPVTGGFVNFDRMLGLNQEKVGRGANEVQQGVQGKVNAAGDAASGVHGAFRAAVTKGSNRYIQSNVPGSKVNDREGYVLTPNNDSNVNGALGSTTRTEPGLAAQGTKPNPQEYAQQAEAAAAPQPSATMNPNGLLSGFRSVDGYGRKPAAGVQTPVVRGQTAPQTREDLAGAAGRGYGGPETLSDMDGYAAAQKAAGQADTALAGLGSAGGLAGLLGYQTPMGGELSGNAALDAGLLQGSAGGKFAELRKRYGNFSNDLTGANAASAGIAQQGKNNTANAQAAYGRDLGAYDANEASVAAQNKSQTDELQRRYDSKKNEQDVEREGGQYLDEHGARSTWQDKDGKPVAPGTSTAIGGEKDMAKTAYEEAGMSEEEANSIWEGMSEAERAACIRAADEHAGSVFFLSRGWEWYVEVARQLAQQKARKNQNG